MNSPFHAEEKATLAFLLSAACRELFPDRTLFIEHSLSDGYYCHFGKGDVGRSGEVEKIARKMEEYLKSDVEIEMVECSRKELEERFSLQGRRDKLVILEAWDVDPVPCIKFGDFIDYRFEPMRANKNDLGPFRVVSYDVGFLLRFPGKSKPFTDAPKLYRITREHEQWGEILGVSNIGELTRLSMTDEIRDMIWVAEGLHEKKISHVADGLCRGFPARRVVFIAGPSASGKTTFSRRLSIQLKVNGLSTRPISMDNYYLNRDLMPLDETGEREFETVAALDVDLLSEHVNRLLDGKGIPERRFDFSRGVGLDTGNTIEVPKNTFIIFEGIHGLNPIFAHRIGKERLQRIYVSAITQLNVDYEHRVSTADNRLLRRLVRDYKFRGYSAEETLSRWIRVREGEEENIFPYQEEADFMFNSSLVYEIPVLGDRAVSLLKTVKSGSSSFSTAQRLLIFLSFFVHIPSRHIPETSILREFIGGGRFVN